MQTVQCLLDMDGVIADFMTQLAVYHGRPSPYVDSSAYGIWDTEKLWGITVEQFWAPIKVDSLAFWKMIPKTPEADAIVALVSATFGEANVAILTAPSDDAGAVPGKRSWIRRNYPQFEKRMIFGSAKEFLAAPYRVLVDDRDKNCEQFRAAGGRSILIPRLWNSRHPYADQALDVLQEELMRAKVILKGEGYGFSDTK